MKTRILSYLILVLFFLIPSSGFAQDSLGISHESISYSFWDYATDAAISGNYAYIGTRETGIKVVDISDIANPFEVAQCRLAGNVQQVAIYDEYLFVPCDYEGMYIIDVSVPEDPEIVYRYTPRRAFEVTFYDHYAFVTVVSDGFSILDITNPAEPELVTNVNPPNGMVKHLKLTETHAFVGKNISEMLIYNIEDIENPVQVGTAEHNNTIDDMELVQEDYLYAISEYGHLQIFNISDPENVEMAAVFVDYNYTEMTQAFPYLFVRSGDTSQYVLDISDPLNPEEVTFLGNLPWHRVVIIDDQNAIACSGEDGIFTLDYQNIAEIEELGVYDTEGRVYGVCLWDHYALLSGKDYGLMIVDVSEPSNPVEVGHYQSEGRIINVEVMDHYALLANQELGLEIIDIIDPANHN